MTERDNKKQAAYRQRIKDDLYEVRGIYLKRKDHKEIKRLAEQLKKRK